MEHENDSDTNCNLCTRHSHQSIDKGTEGFVDKWTSENHPNDSIIKIGYKTKKSLEDLRRLAVTQTPVRKHQQTLLWKTLKRVK